ncbi:MAG TPA: hypothetical protein PKY05_03270 [Fibrobacteria bacterium]|nr:hypothetical protein [Fibrobacteria bacterium]
MDTTASADSAPSPDVPRLPIERIDSALGAYDGGDTLSRKVVGHNDCADHDLYRYRLSNHLVLEGNAYSMYAMEWKFEGEFHPVMGLVPGMGMDQVEAVLGKPVLRRSDRMVYWSMKPDDYEAEYFDSRWKIRLGFSGDSLRTVRFQPFWDDC